MKRLILSTLLLGAVALQSAQAAVRTFEFSGTVSSFMETSPGEVVAGPTGDPLMVGDIVKGQFTFDDLDLDWTAAPQVLRRLPVPDFQVTYGSSDEVDVASGLEWYIEPNSTGQGYSFGLIPYSPFGNGVNLGVSFNVATNIPFWDANSGATGSLFARWLTDNHIEILQADIASVTEVSAVPEPSAYAMLLLGLAGVGAVSRRSRQGRHAAR